MNSTRTLEKPKPKQLRPFALLVILIELGFALWALTMMGRIWLAATGPLPGSFWTATALFGFCAGLVLTNGVGLLQTLSNLNLRPPLGSRLPIRLRAIEEPHEEIMVGLVPLILAFGLPVYPLIQLAWLDWLGLRLIWVGFALTGLSITLVCMYIIGRQIYLIWGGSQTVVELSHETICPDQTIQVALAYRPGRLQTQALEARLVCHQTVSLKGDGRRGRKIIKTILYEETLATYTEADIPLLQSGLPPITTTIPEDAFLSTDPDRYPTIEWRIEVTIKVAKGSDFRLIFPFPVTRVTFRQPRG